MTKAPPPQPKPAARRKAAPAAPDRPRGGEARRVADLIPAIGDVAFRKFGFVQSSIVTRWPEIVGAKLARVTAPESLRFPHGQKAEGVLSITVASAHAPVVQHVIPDVIARVNRFFGYAAVARVRLTQGAVNRRQTTVAVAQTEVPTVPLSPTLRAIADPELRTVLSGLASSLAKRDSLPKIS
jgi:hypothetical protein